MLLSNVDRRRGQSQLSFRGKPQQELKRYQKLGWLFSFGQYGQFAPNNNHTRIPESTIGSSQVWHEVFKNVLKTTQLFCLRLSTGSGHTEDLLYFSVSGCSSRSHWRPTTCHTINQKDPVLFSRFSKKGCFNSVSSSLNVTRSSLPATGDCSRTSKSNSLSRYRDKKL